MMTVLLSTVGPGAKGAAFAMTTATAKMKTAMMATAIDLIAVRNIVCLLINDYWFINY
jgi:hypothetical protein